jgi:hypothetical protein
MSKAKMEIKVICGLGGNCNTEYKLRENNGAVSVDTVLDWIKNNRDLIKDSTSFSIKVSINKTHNILVLKDSESKKPYDFVNDLYIIKNWFDNKFYTKSSLVDVDEDTLTYKLFAYRLKNIAK